MEDVAGHGNVNGKGMGMSLENVYSQARRALLMVRDGLERLERLELAGQQPSLGSSNSPSFRGIGGGGGQDQGGPAAPDLVEHLKQEVAQLQLWSADMDRLWRNQMIAKAQRDLWKRRVEQVAEEVEALKAGLDRYLLRQHRRQMEAQERAELFRRTRGDGAHVLQVRNFDLMLVSYVFLSCV